jgi:phage repressor protein C with HTH and peptisase S24 domain
MPKIHPNRIREFREAAGLSMQALAERVGTSQQQIYRLERSERKLTVDWMIRIGKALAVDPKELMIANAAAPPEAKPQLKRAEPPRPLPDLPSSLHAIPVDLGGPDLPIMGRAQGGSEGVLMIPNDQRPVDWTYRPPQLRGVSDAFAVFAYDDSMHPMYKNGQTLWIHPHLPVKPGDGVLVIKRNEQALIKELVRRTKSELVLRQYRPREEEFALAMREIHAVYRIIGALDLR